MIEKERVKEIRKKGRKKERKKRKRKIIKCFFNESHLTHCE